MFGRIKKLLALICTFAVLSSTILSTVFVSYAADSAETGVNRFNVVLVLDASGSMVSTDPNGYRYEALEQFVFLLADTGNYLGCVVFDTQIRAESAPVAINGQADKDAVVETLESYAPNRGYTNIGESLDVAVKMIEASGNPNLPSVIVFLSDGNTEMPTDDELQESLNKKADAIAAAREDGISIYSVCLNANGKADVSEMQQISSATGGVFNEITVAEDLQGVLNTFYALIYDTISIGIEQAVFSDSGIITQVFDIPGLGVEEANFLLYGQVDSIEVQDAEGNFYAAETLINSSCAMTKVKNPAPGQCTVIVHGEPGTAIYGYIVYNINLVISGGSDLDQTGYGYTDEPVNFYVQLGTGDVMAQSSAQYNGFGAELIITDAYQNVIESVPMTLGDNGFEVTKSFDEVGTHFFKFHITGYNFDKESGWYGPFTIETPPPQGVTPTPIPTNTPPKPVKDEVSITKYLIPFMDKTLVISVLDLATDAEDSKLVYQIESSSFIDGKDYTFDGDKIMMTDYSLYKGDYKIKAIDTGGLSCYISVKVKTVDVGLIAVITVGILALLVLAAIVLTIWYWKFRRLKGTLTFKSSDGTESSVDGGMGQIRLRRFRISSYAGFDPVKTYVQCTSKNYVYFVSKKKFVAVGGRTRDPVKKLRISGNNFVEVKLTDNTETIGIKFQPNPKAYRRGGRHGTSKTGSRTSGRSSSATRGSSRAGRSTGRRGTGGHGIRR